MFSRLLLHRPASLQSSGSASALVQSASKVLFGQSSISDEMTLAPTVVHARLSRVENSALGDGFYSTAVFQVIRSVKGDLSSGTEIAVRQRSGGIGSGRVRVLSNEFQPNSQGEYLLFVSPSAYRMRARNSQPSERFYAQYLLPYRVQQERAFATAPGQNSNGFALSTL